MYCLLSLIASCSKPSSERLLLTGVVGETKNCKFVITKLGDSVEGYFYNSRDTSHKTNVSGSLKGDQLLIKESSKKAKTKFGEFVGKFDGKTYSGLWSNQNGDQQLPFYFTKNLEVLPQGYKKPDKKVSYSAFNKDKSFDFYHGLKAVVNNKSFVLIEDEWICFFIIDIRDFDNDGYEDILVENVEACGGNAVGDSYSFFSYDGNGNFNESEHLEAANIKIEKYGDKWSLEVFRVGMAKSESRIILQKGKTVAVEHNDAKAIKALKEIKVEELSNTDQKSIQFDLNGDGIKDKIIAEYWPRWDLMTWNVQFSNDKIFDSGEAVARLGILSSKTNGVNDLVTDLDDVWIWNGKIYKKK